jgi:hypothetical protein
MKSSIKILTLIDRLQTEATEYVQLYESLLHSYALQLEENERLRDTIAIMADDNYRRERGNNPEEN